MVGILTRESNRIALELVFSSEEMALEAFEKMSVTLADKSEFDIDLITHNRGARQ